MLFSQNAFIVVLGILISLILFNQGEKINFETTDYGQLVSECQSMRLEYVNCVERRENIIKEQFGATAEQIENNKERQMSFLIIPCVVFITALFIGFTVENNERYLTFITLTPLFLSFLRYYPYAAEKWLIPVYFLLAAFLSGLIMLFKRRLFTR